MAANQKFARSLLPKFTEPPPEIAERVNIADVTLQNQVDVANLQAFIDLLYASGEIPEKIDAHRRGPHPMSTPAPSASPAVEVERVAFSYPARSDNGDGTLYEQFSLRGGAGFQVCADGSQRTRKSTLGRMLARIMTPQAGEGPGHPSSPTAGTRFTWISTPSTAFSPGSRWPAISSTR